MISELIVCDGLNQGYTARIKNADFPELVFVMPSIVSKTNL